MKTGSSTYDLVAMITNKNIDNASRSLAYRFTLYDNEGNELGRHTGSITPPIDGDFPIILQNINVEKGIVSRVVTDLLDQPHYAVRSKPKSPTIKVTGTRYEPGQVSRVYAFINNTKQVELENIPVKVILFDISDNAYAVGDTIVPYLGKEESVSISFLWPYQFRDPPAKIRIYPLLDPFNVNQ
jgi:hypothetical protein